MMVRMMVWMMRRRQEVYPVGISLADDAIVGITQRIVRGQGVPTAGPGGMMMASAAQLPCFHPIPESQPVLPCLLRRCDLPALHHFPSIFLFDDEAAIGCCGQDRDVVWNLGGTAHRAPGLRHMVILAEFLRTVAGIHALD